MTDIIESLDGEFYVKLSNYAAIELQELTKLFREVTDNHVDVYLREYNHEDGTRIGLDFAGAWLSDSKFDLEELDAKVCKICGLHLKGYAVARLQGEHNECRIEINQHTGEVAVGYLDWLLECSVEQIHKMEEMVEAFGR